MLAWVRRRVQKLYSDKLKLVLNHINKEFISVKYVITHKTGTGTWDGGKTSGGCLITLTGSDGKTSPHDCVADRGKGVIASCTFNDPVNIGTVTGMTVENISDDQWGFNWVKVSVNGQFKAKWRGSKTVEDYTTRAIVFTPIGLETTFLILLSFLTGENGSMRLS